jgi:hypothetical protein
MRSSIKFTVATVLLSTAVVSAQTTLPIGPIGPIGPSATATTPTQGTGKAVISGTAVDASEAPIPNATVRLRNLVTTQIDQTAVTGSRGQFTFSVRPDVPYVVEIVDAPGRILAVGDVVIPASGDAVATVVSIPAKLSTFAGMFTDTAGSVLAAATGLGLTTLQAGVVPFLSPER